MTTHASQETVAARLAQLPYLPMENLWALWDQYFDRRPGHHHRTWLESRLAYKIQEEAFGAMSSSLKRRLEKIGETGDPAVQHHDVDGTPDAQHPAVFCPV